MLTPTLLLLAIFIKCAAEDYFYSTYNISRTTPSGIEAYRSLLTLDWLEAEDTRQRELAAAYETDATPVRPISQDCAEYPRPAPGKIGRLLLELLKSLEGDEGTLTSELIQVLIRTKLLVDTSMLESEPDFEALVKTPGMMVGEPHATFPRILAVIWILVTDPATVKKHGWCPINKITQYLRVSKPYDIASEIRTMELVIARSRFIMEAFIQNVTPLNMYQSKTTRQIKKFSRNEEETTQLHAIKQRAKEKFTQNEEEATKRNAVKRRANEKGDASDKNVDLSHSLQYSSNSKDEKGDLVLEEEVQQTAGGYAGSWMSWKYFVALMFLV